MRSLLVGSSLSACFLASGCFVDDSHHDGYYVSPALCPHATAADVSVQVEAGPNPTSQPGAGAGVFVEYAVGGHWHVQTVCDTTASQQPCAYDISAQVASGTVSNVAGEGLGSSDFAGTLGADTAYMSVDTYTEVDGMRFDAAPGASVRLTVKLGGELCQGFVWWRTAGSARNDTSSNPLILVPTTP